MERSKINQYKLEIEALWDDDFAYQRVLSGENDHTDIGRITAALWLQLPRCWIDCWRHRNKTAQPKVDRPQYSRP